MAEIIIPQSVSPIPTPAETEAIRDAVQHGIESNSTEQKGDKQSKEPAAVYETKTANPQSLDTKPNRTAPTITEPTHRNLGGFSLVPTPRR